MSDSNSRHDPPGVEDSSSPEQAPDLRRLDPDAAAAEAAQRTERRAQEAAVAEQPVDPRRYRWALGGFGFVLVVAISVYAFATNGVGTTGVPAGKSLRHFVVPLATGHVDADANVNPRCDPRRPNPQGLNVCGRQTAVLAFFVTGSSSCIRSVDALQAAADRLPTRQVMFAAVAIRASRRDTARVVGQHQWTIPVGYDRDGKIGDVFGVEVCPLIEVVRPGSRVAVRLIGERWSDPGALQSELSGALPRLTG